jgi:hypothetical protein
MSTQRAKIYSLLQTTLGIDVHNKRVPELAQKPAAAYMIISKPTEGAIEGGVDLRRCNIQVDLVADTKQTDLDLLVAKLEALDRTSSDDFQYITITSVTDLPGIDSNIDFYQSSVDIELVFKSSSLT